MYFRLQQAADLTGQQDLDVPQGEPSNPRLVNAVLKICWRAAMIGLLCKRAACWCAVCFQSVVDLEQQMLVFGTTVREQVDFVKKTLCER